MRMTDEPVCVWNDACRCSGIYSRTWRTPLLWIRVSKSSPLHYTRPRWVGVFKNLVNIHNPRKHFPSAFTFFFICIPISNRLSHVTEAVATPREATRITEAESCGVVRVVRDSSNAPHALILPPMPDAITLYIYTLHLLETRTFPNTV